MTDLPKPLRDVFEAYAYKHYQTARMSILLANGRDALADEDKREALPKGKYLETDISGKYKREGVNLLWVGWKLCLDSMAPMLEAADLWRLWAEVQDRAADELPLGYEISWHINSKREVWDGAGLVSIGLQHLGAIGDPAVEIPDPQDMESPGLFVRVFECALQAAKDHNAARLN